MSSSLPKRIMGIDYSMSSPAIVIHTGDEWSPKQCQFLYVTKKKLPDPSDLRFMPRVYPSGFNSDTERFYRLAESFVNDKAISDYEFSAGFIENYAMGASGRLATIGENTGVFKSVLYAKKNIVLEAPTPTEIKKFATGKGNAKKEDMLEAFYRERGFDPERFDIHEILGIKKTKKDGSVNVETVSDIIDAYFICKLGFERTKHD